MQTLKKLLYFLTPQERKKAGFLLITILIMALLDTIGVASILPMIAVLSNPNLIETNIILNKIFQVSSVFGVENNQHFLFFLGALVFVILITSISFKAFTTYLQVRFVEMGQYNVGKRVMEGYLQQPYSWFLNRNSSELGKTILSEVGQVIAGGIGPVLELTARGLIVFLIITLLIIIDPKLAIIVGITLGLAYWIVYSLVRGYITRVGGERLKNNELRFRSISEAFGAAKEVKVGGLEQVYVNVFLILPKDSQKLILLLQSYPHYLDIF